MARGYDTNQARKRAIAGFGRALARRASSRCELCEAGGVRLDVFEVPPAPDEADVAHCALLCERCTRGVGGGPLDPHDWRFVESTMYCEIGAVQVLAVRALRRLAAAHVHWASAALDGLYLSEEILSWADQVA